MDNLDNKVEKLITKAMAGEMEVDAFMSELMVAEIFMPVRDKYEINGLQLSEKAVPLTSETEAGEKTLILFTNPELAKNYVKDFPRYGGGLLTNLEWIIENLGNGFGISINPNSEELGMDLGVGMLDSVSSH